MNDISQARKIGVKKFRESVSKGDIDSFANMVDSDKDASEA